MEPWSLIHISFRMLDWSSYIMSFNGGEAYILPSGMNGQRVDDDIDIYEYGNA